MRVDVAVVEGENGGTRQSDSSREEDMNLLNTEQATESDSIPKANEALKTTTSFRFRPTHG